MVAAAASDARHRGVVEQWWHAMTKSHRVVAAGQGLVEYALIILFVAIALVGALTILGGTLADFYQTAAAAFPGS